MGIYCWWFGHDRHPDDYSPPDEITCMNCGRHMSYDDLVGDTRHMRFMNFVRYWFFRKWFPAKCLDCGRRWRECDDTVDHIPF